MPATNASPAPAEFAAAPGGSAAEGAAEFAVALVGAGPRGTSVLERLCASAESLLPPGARLTVHVIDPAPPGAGRVWRPEQSGELLMNTVASQVTLFTDPSVDCAGPIRPGPSLYEWAAEHSDADGADQIGPDEYPTRALYGRYLEWVFADVVRRAPARVRIETHRTRAIRLTDESASAAPDTTPPDPTGALQTLLLADGRELTGLCAVVLAQGHLPAVGGPEQRRLAAHAERHGLRYFPPANPADLDLSVLAPGAPVLLRGLGLNFFDHMALLTSGRGGRFVPAERDGRDGDGAGGLRYLPSGREPRLFAGSRRGIPYQARGDNAKGPYGRHEPLLLTGEVIERFRKRADEGDPPDFLDEIWPLVAKEVETVYYEALLARRTTTPRPHHADGTPRPPENRFRDTFRDRFLAAPHRTPEEALVLDEFGIAPADRWSWDRISRPYRTTGFEGTADFRRWLADYLREDAAQAALGNVEGPVKAALDVLRDVRNEVRLIVDHGGIRGASRREHLDRWYTPLNAFLSIGPPRRRIEEMAALLEAGVLEVVGPRMRVRAEDGAFVAESPLVPGSMVRAGALIEARLPEPDLRRTGDELLARLLKTGECRPHVVDGYETGGLDVTPRPYHLIDRQNQPHMRRFAFGVPTEGVHWVTAAGARPGVDSVTLSDADAVARAALRTIAGTGARTGSGTGSREGGEAEAEQPECTTQLNVELASID